MKTNNNVVAANNGELPLTIMTTTSSKGSSMIVIGDNRVSTDSSIYNSYWILVVDRTSLKVVENFTFKDNSSVPSQINPYLGNSDYFMIFTTKNIGTDNLPQGALYTFLREEGAGAELTRSEQIYETLNCGYYGSLSYSLVAVLGSDGLAFENMDTETMITTLKLMPTTVNGNVIYSPTTING